MTDPDDAHGDHRQAECASCMLLEIEAAEVLAAVDSMSDEVRELLALGPSCSRLEKLKELFPMIRRGLAWHAEVTAELREHADVPWS